MPLDPEVPISGNISWGSQNTNPKEYMHLYIDSNVIYNLQGLETVQCPSVDEWIKKLWHIYTIEY